MSNKGELNALIQSVKTSQELKVLSNSQDAPVKYGKYREKWNMKECISYRISQINFIVVPSQMEFEQMITHAINEHEQE